ncbi:hypothetical protein SAMN05880582_1011618 [Rhizobium sp. RU20A]|uniref:hypothetical protein n=1 Tax=Rhizobium sp. RU20A TaxID=1907412 RepID=UPI000955FCAB|nr:hypothetical protein [Rhizobium sp. RU20A]SIQ36632.1 hypothetical protein SAMN05880582_1011618 [Rhizobium sp. RU20A]
MVNAQARDLVSDTIGVGSYTAPEAARLLRMKPRNLRRWLGGYTYSNAGKPITMPPLWRSEHAGIEEGHLEIGFRDLIELRFVKAFLDAGVGLQAIRNCLAYACECARDERPFSTRKFRTDGRTIFLDSVEQNADKMPVSTLLDLKKKQFVFKDIVERTFKDLDIEGEAVVRWRPHHGKQSIVIDPRRSFGQPIATEFGVPTVVLADAVVAEGSVEEAARIFDVPPAVLRDAVDFENDLKRAA